MSPHLAALYTYQIVSFTSSLMTSRLSAHCASVYITRTVCILSTCINVKEYCSSIYCLYVSTLIKEVCFFLPSSLPSFLPSFLVRSLTHSLTHSNTHTLIYLLTQSLTHSLTHTHIHSLTHFSRGPRLLLLGTRSLDHLYPPSPPRSRLHPSLSYRL